jgi:uroporphyrinogen-III synthase
LAGRFDVTLFTTGVQAEHFLMFAEEKGLRDAAKEALERTFVASIGPTCSEALRGCGLQPELEPSHPKMGILVREAAIGYAASRAQRVRV